MPGFIKMEMEDRLAIVTVNRPDALNALNSSVLRELSMAIEHLSMAADVGALILTGAGDRAFVAGADIKEMANLSGLEMQRFSEMGRRLGDAMASCNKPIIAAINGFALGGGCELALACDIRIASNRAELGQPEVNIGIIPGFGGSQRLPRLVGPGWAAEMIYTGDRIDAATAARTASCPRQRPSPTRSWRRARRPSPSRRRASARRGTCRSPPGWTSRPPRSGSSDRRTTRRKGCAPSSRNASPRGQAPDQYDSNSSCRSITTCSRTSSNDELRYSRIPPSSLWMRAMKLFELFRNSTFTRDSSIVIRSWGTVRRGVPFGRIRGPYLRVARRVCRNQTSRRGPRETRPRRGSPPNLYLAHDLWSASSY